MKRRDTIIDLLKTIGIVAVVAFHCNLFSSFFFLFHNPLFMFAAGVFHPRDASTTWVGYCGYLKKRVQRIYLPFVLLTAFLTLVQPLLVKMGLLPEAPYTLRELPMKLLTILAMRVEGFSGPCWFLISLLEISIAFEAIRYFAHRLPPQWEMGVLLVISIVLFPIGIYTNLPRVLDESMIMFVWYVVGFYVRPHLDTLRAWQLALAQRSRCIWLAGLCGVCIILLPCMVLLANRGCGWRGGAMPPVVALGISLGILWSFSFANILNSLPFARYLAMPGICSFTIMAWHLGAFRLLSVLRVLLMNMPKERLLGSYGIYDGVWPVVYCLWGVLLPTIGKIYWGKLLRAPGGQHRRL